MEVIGVSHREHGAPAENRAPPASARDDEHLWRTHVYGLLATLLVRPPNASLLETLSGIDASRDDSVMAPAWRALKSAADPTEAAALDDEYHTLFIGIGRGELMPYASWYLTGFLMERPLAQLRGALRALGIERQAGVCEPEDHVAVLCEAMRVIIERGDNLSGATERGFFDDHMAPWMGQFFHDMQHAESARFYRAVGQLGEAFIRVEQQYFDMTP